MKKYIYLLSVSMLATFSVQAQSDVDKINEARTALEKYKDCNTALKVLQGVTKDGQNEMMFIYYVAKASEECKLLEQAVEYYTKYAS